jgi:hypothetical protein
MANQPKKTGTGHSTETAGYSAAETAGYPARAEARGNPAGQGHPGKGKSANAALTWAETSREEVDQLSFWRGSRGTTKGRARTAKTVLPLGTTEALCRHPRRGTNF